MSVLTRSALSSSFNTNLPDNNSGLITPEVLRGELINTIDSAVFPEDTGSSFIQSFDVANAATVTVDHNLDDDFPIVQIYSASRVQLVVDISSSSANQITVGPFSIASTGSIIISKLR
jgi:hypothetical protein